MDGCLPWQMNLLVLSGWRPICPAGRLGPLGQCSVVSFLHASRQAARDRKLTAVPSIRADGRFLVCPPLPRYDRGADLRPSEPYRLIPSRSIKARYFATSWRLTYSSSRLRLPTILSSPRRE